MANDVNSNLFILLWFATIERSAVIRNTIAGWRGDKNKSIQSVPFPLHKTAPANWKKKKKTTFFS